ncbi:hypothetical protein HMPREF1199_02000 [Hoylesella oralis CC98A]|nr:hypothetical protein HMPREF1199_02000 [Hoylesella oralis CC98A]
MNQTLARLNSFNLINHKKNAGIVLHQYLRFYFKETHIK